MPSWLHEVLVLLFQKHAELAAKLVRDCLRRELPPYREVRLDTAALSDLQPAEYRADLVVVLLDEDNHAVHAIVVEVQLRPDPDKVWVWPAYVVGLRARLRCPVTLLVVTAEEKVARWAGAELELGGGNVWRPLVVGPSAVPVIEDAEQARRAPELAVLSVIAHCKDRDVERSVRAALAAIEGLAAVDEDRSVLYYDVILASLSEAAREALEAMMKPQEYEYQSDFARRYFGQGREQGLQEGLEQGLEKGLEKGREEGIRLGRAAVVLRLLERKFGSVPGEVEARVRQASIEELDTFAERILTAGDVGEVLGDP